MERPQPISEFAALRTLAAWDVVRKWPMGPALKLAWYKIWFERAGGRPNTITLTSAYASDCDARRGRDAIEQLVDEGLLEAIVTPDKRSRRPGAQTWELYVVDPAEAKANRLARVAADPQHTFEFAVEDDGGNAAAEGSAEAVTTCGGSPRAADVVPFKPGHDATNSPSASTAPAHVEPQRTPPREATPHVGAGLGPPRPAAEFAPTPPQVGLKTSREIISPDFRLGLVDPATSNRSGYRKSASDGVRDESAAAAPAPVAAAGRRAGDPQPLGLALAEQLSATLAARQRTPGERLAEVFRVSNLIRGRVNDSRLQASVVTKVAEAVVDGRLKERKLLRLFDSLDQAARLPEGHPQRLRGPRFGYFVTAAKRAFHESGLDWRTEERRS